MIVTEMRLEMRLTSPMNLILHMRYRELSVQALATRVGCSKSMIGHLCTGHRKSCSPEMARKIEKALDQPRGSLFIAKVATVSRETRRPTAAA